MKLSPDQLEEHRLEIENRIRNLFWTVSGDYSLEIHPDIQEFGRSEFLALYNALKQGAFARYFDAEEMALYIMKKTHLKADEKVLMELVQLCIEIAVYPLICEARKGVDEIRTNAWKALVELEKKPAVTKVRRLRRSPVKEEKPSVFHKARNLMLCRYLIAQGELASDDPFVLKYEEDEEACRLLREIAPLEEARTTAALIETVDRLYNKNIEPDFEETHGSLRQVLAIPSDALLYSAVDQEALSDEQMDAVMQKFLSNLRRDMLRLSVDGKKNGTGATLTREMAEKVNFATPTEESAKKVKDYVALSYGQSYLSDADLRRNIALLCRGPHKGCFLHYTDGILHNPLKKNNQYLYSEMLTQKNRMYYYGNHRIIKRNIDNLANSLSHMIALRQEKEIWRDRSGTLVPSRMWKLGRTEDDKLFNKTFEHDDSEFVVEILLDGSGSQMKRQNQVAAQGYMISEALSRVGIPHRVSSYCTFWDYTILHRFRDYDAPKTDNERIFEYHGSATNRDGLAIRAACQDLLNRQEAHKILIILSDGKPNDIGRSSQGNEKVRPYLGKEAVRDTAFEIRKARAMDIAVLGIFSGHEEDLEAEKKIFGSDFAYIRNLNNFSKVTENYLCKQLEQE
ncbi:MAG: nitric oxide reductase activation protein [Lachnospiraceae bacterium]|nr:nitric oxide reductase activation protein [Lachnospiraceae bacterium]